MLTNDARLVSVETFKNAFQFAGFDLLFQKHKETNLLTDKFLSMVLFNQNFGDDSKLIGKVLFTAKIDDDKSA